MMPASGAALLRHGASRLSKRKRVKGRGELALRFCRQIAASLPFAQADSR